jgi:hypothetical protein
MEEGLQEKITSRILQFVIFIDQGRWDVQDMQYDAG